MKKCYLYLRVSTTKQDYERQREDLTKFANAYDWEIVDTFEDKQSGKDDERTGFLALRAQIENPTNEVKTVLVWECSRLSRRISTLSALIDDWKNKHINVMFYKERCWLFYPETGAEDRQSYAFLCVISAFAQIEIEGMRQRIESSRKKYIENNQTFNAKPGFGWVRNKDTKKLEVYEKEAVIIRRAYNLIANGQSLTRTERQFRLEYPDVAGVISFFKKMDETKYIGRFVLKNGVIDVPPIVSEELFNRAIKTLRDNDTRDRDKPSKAYRLLQGILRCPVCGKNMYVKEQYLCPSQFLRLPDRCNAPSITSSILDNIVLNFCKTPEFQAILDKKYSRIINEEQGKINEIIANNNSRVALLQVKIAEIKKKISRLRLAFADSDEDEELAFQSFQNKKKRLDNEIQRINNEIAEIKTTNERLEESNMNAFKDDIFSLEYPSEKLQNVIKKWFNVAYLCRKHGASKYNFDLVLHSDFLIGEPVENNGEDVLRLHALAPDTFTLSFNTGIQKGRSHLINVQVYATHSCAKVGDFENPKPAFEQSFNFNFEKSFTKATLRARNKKKSEG